MTPDPQLLGVLLGEAGISTCPSLPVLGDRECGSIMCPMGDSKVGTPRAAGASPRTRAICLGSSGTCPALCVM